MVALAIIVVATGEEMLWRGMVPMLLSERAGSRRAWVWSAFLYALSYVPTAWALRAGVGAGGLDPLLVIHAALGAGLLWGRDARTASAG